MQARHLLRFLGRREPLRDGAVRVAGLHGAIEIAWDANGVPHIGADHEPDAWFGLGWCHALDRGFQLELLVRVGRGTLAELVGPGGLRLDRLSRRLGFRHVARAGVDLLDADVRATIEAYAAGIDAGIRHGPLPHELRLLGAQRTSWRAEDVLAFALLQTLALSGNWDSELARLKILALDGEEALRAVDAAYPSWLPVTAPVAARAGDGVDLLAADLAVLRRHVAGAAASNNWAVAGGRTATGAPSLGNDPHLNPQVPSQWYLAHLRTPAWSLSGASMVGGPAFPIGQTDQLAWGITAGLTDSVDLFIEERIDERHVRGAAGLEPCEVREELIRVRGRPAVVERVMVTPRGPIVGDLMDGVEMALSFSAPWLRPAPIRGFFDAPRATSVAQLRAAFATWPGPALNVVMADRAGSIGWQLVGVVPDRSGDAGPRGMLPLPAWECPHAVERGTVSFDAMPFSIDPPAGWLATANNAPRRPGDDGPYLGSDWIDGFRLERIGEVLASAEAWDVADSLRMQTDRLTAPWRRVCEELSALETSDGAARIGRALLADWDGRMEAHSIPAAIFELTLAALARELVRTHAPRAWRWALGEGFGPPVDYTLLAVRHAGLALRMLERGQPAERGRQLEHALGSAVRELIARRGPDPRRWRWGAVRPLTFRHPLGAIRPLGRLLNLGPFPVGGDANTVMQASVSALEPWANPGAVAGVRAAMDVADRSRSRFVLAGGQSGNPLSPHYDDQLALWLRGDALQIPVAPEAIAAATRHRQRLLPVRDAR